MFMRSSYGNFSNTFSVGDTEDRNARKHPPQYGHLNGRNVSSPHFWHFISEYPLTANSRFAIMCFYR
jgi:hypothetical protein